jgi:hypothetical protein
MAVYTQAVDSDDDGMPDNFELAMGLNPTNAADAVTSLDADPFSNLEEYIAGTDPADPLDYLQLQVERLSSDQLKISWDSVLGRRYHVESCTSLESANWVPMQDLIPASGQPVERMENPSGYKPYFRLAVAGAL